MKTILTLIFLLSLSSLSIQGQNTDIIYNPHKNTFTGENKLKKGTKVTIYIENFNPFLYASNVEVSTKDNQKKLFEFLSGILINGFGIEPKDNNRNSFAAADVSLNNFIILQEKYINLDNELKNPYFDYKKISAKVSTINNSENIYIEYLKLSKTDRDKLLLTKEEIIKLSETKIAVEYYINHQIESKNGKHYLKLADYNVTGSSNTIKIKLSSKLEDRKDSIIGMKKINVKNTGKIDFSTGLFITQNNEPQYFKTQNTNNNFVIGEENLNEYQIGVNALAHIYLNNNNTFNITLGSGISVDKALHLLTGISYKFDNSNFIINLGTDFSNYNELSDAQELGKEYATDIEIKTKKRWNTGFWLGVSYKL